MSIINAAKVHGRDHPPDPDQKYRGQGPGTELGWCWELVLRFYLGGGG